MSTMKQGHLNDEQFAECVAECSIVAPSAESEAHLRECSACREELARFTASMEDFSSAAFAWSEAQPAVSLRAESRPLAGRVSWLAPATWAAATAVLLAVGVPMVIHHDRQPAVTAVADSPDDSDAQIAEDNQLMRSVNTAIGANDASPLREYGLPTGRRARLKTVSGLRSE